MLKKILMALILIVFSLGMLGAMDFPFPVEGIYDLTPAKIKSKEINKYFKAEILKYKQAQVVETKPDILKVEPEITTFKGLQYGSIRLGNNEKDVWFVIRKNDFDYYSELYVDQNFDNNITSQEKVPNLDTWEDKDGSLLIHSSSTYPKSVPVMVSYKSTAYGEITKKLSFYIHTQYIMKKNGTNTLWIGFINTSALEGTFTVTIDHREKDIRFRLIDTNANGCYNDYKKDNILMDLNEDGKFTEDEAQSLFNYFVVKVKKQKKQLQLAVMPCPAKVAVIGVNQDFDSTQLEPEPDPLNTEVTGKQVQTKSDKDED
jgi:hypothetical protein